MELLLRFHDPDAGRITLDGVDLRDLAQSELRAQIGYVPQQAVLFSGTIASNIRNGRLDAGEEEVAEAARIAQALEFIAEREEGFQSEVAQGD